MIKIDFSTHSKLRLDERTLLEEHNLRYLLENECATYIGITNDFKKKYYLFFSITSFKYYVLVLGKNGTIITILPIGMFKETYRINEKIKVSTKCRALSIFFSFTYKTTFGKIKQTPTNLLDYCNDIYDVTSDLELFNDGILNLASKCNVDVNDILDVTVTNSNNTIKVKYDALSILDEKKWMSFMEDRYGEM